MLDKSSYSEIEDLVERAVARAVKDAASKELEHFMRRYELKPHHWVWLDAEYTRTLNRQTQIRRVIIGTIVTMACILTIGGVESWVKEFIVAYHASK